MTALAPTAAGFDAVAPALFAAGGACIVLLLEVVLSAHWWRERQLLAEHRLGILLAVVATLCLGLAVWQAADVFIAAVRLSVQAGGTMVALDRYSALGVGLIGINLIFAIWLSTSYLQTLQIHHGEYYALILLSASGMFIAVSSTHLISLFAGFELMTLPLVVLAGFDRAKRRSNEAALKLFLTASFATAIGLYGAALLYGATGALSYEGIRAGFAATPLGLAGLALVFAAMAFKIAVPPFQQWQPDVHEGSPAPVSALLSVTVPLVGFVVLMGFLVRALPDGAELAAGEEVAGTIRGISGLVHLPQVHDVFVALAIAAIVLGNGLALVQNNFKRLLAHAGIAHAGYLLLAVVANTSEAYSAALFYGFVYSFASLGVYGVVVAVAQGGREHEGISDLAGLGRQRPGLALAALLFLLALIGVPGTAGFIAKFKLFSSLVNANCTGLAVLAVVASALSGIYYLKVPIAMFMRESHADPPPPLGSNEFIVLLLSGAVVIYFGFFFDFTVFERAVEALR